MIGFALWLVAVVLFAAATCIMVVSRTQPALLVRLRQRARDNQTTVFHMTAICRRSDVHDNDVMLRRRRWFSSRRSHTHE